MYEEDELLPVSALQHLIFCERQWALIHLEQIWAENPLTAEGRILHEQAHEHRPETRKDLRVTRGLRLRCLRLGLTGVADVVEFHQGEAGISLPGLTGLWRPEPIEYKRGRPKPEPCDEIQLCAQALCLEEMLQTEVPAGAIFYGQPRRRHHVDFNPELRRQTEAAAARLHELTRRAVTPQARYEKKCRSCSLVDQCLPKTTGSRRKVADYLLAAAYEPPGLEEG